MEIGEPLYRLHQSLIGFGSGNNLQQTHVAWRVEKVRAEPAATKVLGKAFCDLGHGKAAGVGSNDRPRAANGIYLSEEFSLDFEVFDHCLNDPIHVR